jgi:2-polyprenyl-6-methoxyphenol hydroxylase-like FAD-dependent oxidoreductase
VLVAADGVGSRVRRQFLPHTAHRTALRHALALREPVNCPTKLYNIADNIGDNWILVDIEIY